MQRLLCICLCHCVSRKGRGWDYNQRAAKNIMAVAALSPLESVEICNSREVALLGLSAR